MQRKFLLLMLIITLFCMGIANSNVYAQTNVTRIYAKYDAVLADSGPGSYGQIIYLSDNSIKDWSPQYPGSLVGDYAHYPIGGKNGTEYFTYFLFYLNKIPQSDLWTSVTINSIEFKALLDDIEAQNQTFVSLNLCQMDYLWYKTFEKENSLTKYYTPLLDNDTRMMSAYDCKMSSPMFSPLDSVIVKKNELPSFYTWDLTHAQYILNQSPITLLLVAWPETRTVNSILPDSLLSVQSVYGSAQRIGVNAMPSIVVTYTVEPSQFQQSVIFFITNGLPAIGVVGTSVAWFVRREAKRNKPA